MTNDISIEVRQQCFGDTTEADGNNMGDSNRFHSFRLAPALPCDTEEQLDNAPMRAE